MQTRLITTEPELLALQNSWNDLLRRNPAIDLPFYSWNWFHASWTHFAKPEGRSLFVIAVEDEDRLLGVLPLVTGTRKSSGISYRTLEFCNVGMNPRNTAYFDPSCPEAVFAEMENALRSAKSAWDMLELSNLAESSAFHDFWLRERFDSFSGTIRTRGLTSPMIELTGTLDDYLASLDKKTRYNVKRHVRMFEESDRAPEVRVYRRPEEVESALKYSLEVRKNSWKGAHRNPNTPRFYAEILPELFHRGEAVVIVVFLEQTPIGAALRLTRNGVYYGFGTNFDQRYKADAPGTLMFYYMLEFILRNGGIAFDFCGDDYGYKSRYATGLHRHSTFQMFHTGWKSRFLYSAKTRWLPLLRKILGKPVPDDAISDEQGLFTARRDAETQS